MELKKVGAPARPAAKKRSPRARQRVPDRAPNINPEEYCLTCQQWIPPAMRQNLRRDRPQEEWNDHPDCFKKQVSCLLCRQAISLQMRMRLRRERPRPEWDYHPDCWKQAGRSKPAFR